MIGFLIKKTFYDLWDNMHRAVLINLGFIVSLAVPVFLAPLFESLPPLFWIVLLGGVLWCFVYLAAAALSLKAVSDYGSFGFGDFFRNLKAGWPAGLVLGLLVLGLWVLAAAAFPFYLGMESLAGLFFSALIFWVLAAALLSLQLFFPVRARLDKNLFKVLKKCGVIFLDNPGFCVFSFFYNLVVLGVSVFLAFIVPGPAGVLLFLDEGLRLRLLKYDWLEANPAEAAAGRSAVRRIPWDDILAGERERTGSRSLKNLVFPWKN
jgi:hypothetical protein